MSTADLSQQGRISQLAADLTDNPHLSAEDMAGIHALMAERFRYREALEQIAWHEQFECGAAVIAEKALMPEDNHA